MRRLRRIAQGLLIPDTFAEWIPFAICRGRRVLRSFGPDLIFSSSNPASSHLVAAYLSREAHIPLVIEYGDPWNHLIERPRHGLRARIELWQERTVLQKASFVFMATHAARSLYVEKWPFVEHKIDVVENGYDPDDFSSGILPPSDEFRLTYAGVVHTGGRSVDAFIEALASMKVTGRLPPSIRINFWGEFSPVLLTKLKQLGLDQVIRIGGWLNHNDFCRALLGSHGLLLFGNRHVQQVPGKLYQYLGAGRPVFLIDNSEEPERDHTRLLVSRQPHAIIVENSAEAISSALLVAYREWSVLRAVDYVGIRDSASGETWTARARQLDHCFAQVVAR